MKIFVLLIVIFSIACQVENERHVHLNGEHLELEGIQIVDQLFDHKVVDGNYWVNESGQWGLEDDSNPRGTINLQAAAQIKSKYEGQEGSSQQAPSGGTQINTSQNGSVVSGKVNGKNCTYVSAGGMTMKSCD